VNAIAVDVKPKLFSQKKPNNGVLLRNACWP
jgi:hypothetical protein